MHITNPAPRGPYIKAETIDDLMRTAIEDILLIGDPIHPTRGRAREVTGYFLELSNPRARMSRSETRGKLFSCIGELCWYLSGSDDPEFVAYYIPKYRDEAENGKVRSAYGPRLMKQRGVNQIESVIKLLRDKSDTRRAAIQLFDAEDLEQTHKEVPCTCTLQFLLRRGRLQLLAYLRSNDVFKGLAHDAFCFTMIQEFVARKLGADLGSYCHIVGSLHLYDDNESIARTYLSEGWQSTKPVMPPMPIGDPSLNLEEFLRLEALIRTANAATDVRENKMDDYWLDLARILRIFRAFKNKDQLKMRELAKEFSRAWFGAFVEASSARL